MGRRVAFHTIPKVKHYFRTNKACTKILWVLPNQPITCCTTTSAIRLIDFNFSVCLSNQDGPIKIAIRGGIDTPLGGQIIISRILEGGAAHRYGMLAGNSGRGCTLIRYAGWK